MSARCGVNVALVGGVDRPLSDGQPFSHPPSEGVVVHRSAWTLGSVGEHLGEFADGQVFAQGGEVAVKFNVVVVDSPTSLAPTPMTRSLGAEVPKHGRREPTGGLQTSSAYDADQRKTSRALVRSSNHE